jgi:glycosyltransferase involved in cell wall biosynthesis
MKILLLSNMYPSIESPHYGVFVANFTKEFSMLGITINKVVITKKNSKIKKLISYFIYTFECCWKVLFTKYDLIYVHYINHSLIPFIFLRFFIKKPFIINAHGGDVFYESKVAKFIAVYTSKVLPYATKIVVPSNYFKKELINRFKLKEDVIFISPSGGINLEIFKPRVQSVVLPLKIGYVGRIDLNKGWDTFIEAIVKLRNESIEIHIGGDGKEYFLLKELIKRYKLSNIVKLYGYIDHEKINEFFNLIDVLVFPSRRNGESLGLVPIEALACGVPVIANDNGAVKDFILNKENGFLYYNDSSEELKNKLLDFQKLSVKEKLKMSKMAITSVQKYDSKLISEKLKHFILNINER